jgi:hypothetical protein
MKMKYLPMLLIITACFVSCKKESKTANGGKSSLSGQTSILGTTPVAAGKWQETKLRMYELDSMNTILYDTIYVHPFTSSDYLVFNADGTCVIGTDHYYYLNSPGSPKVPQQISPVATNYSYAAIASYYVLNAQISLENPGGFVTADTLSANSTTVLLHSVFYSHEPGLRLISDSYYTK